MNASFIILSGESLPDLIEDNTVVLLSLKFLSFIEKPKNENNNTIKDRQYN
jgi:hypothetical protein